MTVSVKLLNDQIKRISDTNTLLDMLLEFERFLDESNLYSYKNWKKGELLSGPNLDRNYCHIKLMYHQNEMPDPDGADRLLNAGCMVKYSKDTLISPVKVTRPEDIILVTRDNGTIRKRAKSISKPVWVVDLKIPRKYVDEFKTDKIQLGDDSMLDSENLNSEDQAQTQQERQGSIGINPTFNNNF